MEERFFIFFGVRTTPCTTFLPCCGCLMRRVCKKLELCPNVPISLELRGSTMFPRVGRVVRRVCDPNRVLARGLSSEPRFACRRVSLRGTSVRVGLCHPGGDDWRPGVCSGHGRGKARTGPALVRHQRSSPVSSTPCWAVSPTSVLSLRVPSRLSENPDVAKPPAEAVVPPAPRESESRVEARRRARLPPSR